MTTSPGDAHGREREQRAPAGKLGGPCSAAPLAWQVRGKTEVTALQCPSRDNRSLCCTRSWVFKLVKGRESFGQDAARELWAREGPRCALCICELFVPAAHFVLGGSERWGDGEERPSSFLGKGLCLMHPSETPEWAARCRASDSCSRGAQRLAKGIVQRGRH